MNRRRKTTLRLAKPKRLDQHAVMFAHTQTDETKHSWHTWRFRVVSVRSAQQMVADDQAYVVEREHNGQKLVMYREKQALRPSRTSPCSLTVATLDAVAAAALGFNLSASQEAHVARFIMWPMEFDYRNPSTVRAGTWQDLRRAEKFLKEAQKAA